MTTVLHDRIAALPDDPFAPPPREAIRHLLGMREAAEPIILEHLMQGTSVQRVPHRGYRSVYLLSLVGEWRSENAVPALLKHLDTPWGYGWDEVPHAAARIGKAAITPMAYAAMDTSRSVLVRRRAIRCLASIAASATRYGPVEGEYWIGDWKSQREDIDITLGSFLYMESAPIELVDEAAHRLCDLRTIGHWPRIKALFDDGTLKPRDGWNVGIAHDLMHGHLFPVELCDWSASMTNWMTRQSTKG